MRTPSAASWCERGREASRSVDPPSKFRVTGSIVLDRRHATGMACIIGSALAFEALAIFAGLSRIGPTRASTLSTIEPVFTVVLASLVLGERIEMLQILGGGLILIAVVMLARAATGNTGAKSADISI